ncbi:MAG TPA: glycosyl hydrolase [Phycisphaerae bacterium]|nr:glycosyl hydrolase [Phycisphaerae bacterium]HRY70343.1 glycosyl hydrolase [Phycisphaerae bacterium]HSA28060.1 glycosyl hydrolase [Phycisphaerae bacterium]
MTCSTMLRNMLLASLVFLSAGRAAVHADDWRHELATPRPEFSQMPFWFWNDRLEEEEIKRQMADFREHGVYGFIIHARMGLPKDIPYMGERWLQLVRAAVEEAKSTNMRVCLYDEGMYPSGSAHGEVVRSNPSFAAKGLTMTMQDVAGPADLPRPAPSNGTLVATLIARPTPDSKAKAVEPTSLKLVDAAATSIKVPQGPWRVMTFACVPSKGRIRGVHEDEEDSAPAAPPAANLLDPAAMQVFIRFAYEPYDRILREHFGKTVIAMFTDEPNMLGRRSTPGLQPWTDGIEHDYERQHGDSLLPLLPALFLDLGPETATVRARFHQTLARRLNDSYYRQLSEWCDRHGIALTGHPAGPTEIDPLHYFQIPGQDIVWRGLLPEKNLALQGTNSAIAKCTSSVARHDGRWLNANEVYGAFGWQLTMEEMKWLADWLMVRGVNTLYPHAFYYSIRGNRFNERPPDVGPNNAWWPHYRLFADYTSRLCGLLADSRQVCHVAILCRNNQLPWRAAEHLYRNQIDFNYLEEWRLIGQARIEDSSLAVGPMRYTLLVVDQDEPLAKTTQARIDELERAGLRVSYCTGGVGPELVHDAPRDLTVDPASPDLRCTHLRKRDHDFYLLVNEGDRPIETGLTVPIRAKAEWFDAWESTFRPTTVQKADHSTMTITLQLERRSSLVLCIDRGQPHTEMPAAPPPAAQPPTTIHVPGPWQLSDTKGKLFDGTLGNWLQNPDTTGLAGTVLYRTSFDLKKVDMLAYRLHLGAVGDFAAVRLNGQALPPRFWAPYRWDVTQALKEGRNELTVEVTNSLVNRYDPKQLRPSGLIGPVELQAVRSTD